MAFKMIHPSPKYQLTTSVIFDLALAWVFVQHRSFTNHALRLLPGIHPPLRVWGKDNIPCAGPGVITVNHYWSPTFWAPWIAIALSAIVPVDIYWTMTDAFTYPSRRFARYRRAVSHILLTRIARVYAFNTMPPMPPAPGEAPERAASVKRLLEYVRQNPSALVGLAPEGYDRPGGVLDLPPQGAGRLALALSRLGLYFIPVGAFEESGEFCLCFGKPYRLEVPRSDDRMQVDLFVREMLTREVARCLPQRLRGGF